uniref:Uncharacterized protein n=1 Tax=Arundo donax TaxID=35708 RepID=A0A0A8XVA2_ARUDO
MAKETPPHGLSQPNIWPMYACGLFLCPKAPV